jgi:hypothetical protein
MESFELIEYFTQHISNETDFEKRIKKLLHLFSEKIMNTNFILLFTNENWIHVFFKSEEDRSTILSRDITIERKYIKKEHLTAVIQHDCVKKFKWHNDNIWSAWNYSEKEQKKCLKAKDTAVVPIECLGKKVGWLFHPPKAKAIDNFKDKDEVEKVMKDILSIAAISEFSLSTERFDVRSGIGKILGKDDKVKPLTNFYHRLITACGEVFNAEAASLYLETANGDQLRAVAGIGHGEIWVDDIFYDKKEQKGITWCVWQKKVNTFRWGELNKPLKEEFEDLVMDKGKADKCVSLMAVPIITGGKRVGVLKVENKYKIENGRKKYLYFNAADQRKLETIAQVLAGNLERRFTFNDEAASYFDINVFGRKFFEELFDACEKVNVKKKDVKYCVELIRRFAAVLKQAKCSSRDELFDYVRDFNEKFCKKIMMPESFINIIGKLAKVERALYTIPVYRDHLIHQTQVFLLGFLILVGIKNELIEKKTNIAKKMGLNDSSWLKRWYLASAFHDIGYSFEGVEDWQNLLFEQMLKQAKNEDELKPSSSMNDNEPSYNQREKKSRSFFNWGSVLAEGEIGTHFETLLSHIYKILAVEKKDKIKSDIRQKILQKTLVIPSHATMGALVFLGNSSITDMKSNKYKEMIKDAAAAICLHDPEVAGLVSSVIEERRINFNKAPFALLLAFCDTVQEWGRVNPQEKKQIDEKFGSPLFVDFNIINEKVEISLCYYKEPFSETDWINEIYSKYIDKIEDYWEARGNFCILYFDEFKAGGDNEGSQMKRLSI